MTLRNWLYRAARISGDIEAVRHGRIHKRLMNRLIGRHIVSRLWWR